MGVTGIEKKKKKKKITADFFSSLATLSPTPSKKFQILGDKKTKHAAFFGRLKHGAHSFHAAQAAVCHLVRGGERVRERREEKKREGRSTPTLMVALPANLLLDLDLNPLFLCFFF